MNLIAMTSDSLLGDTSALQVLAIFTHSHTIIEKIILCKKSNLNKSLSFDLSAKTIFKKFKPKSIFRICPKSPHVTVLCSIDTLHLSASCHSLFWNYPKRRTQERKRILLSWSVLNLRGNNHMADVPAQVFNIVKKINDSFQISAKQFQNIKRIIGCIFLWNRQLLFLSYASFRPT